MRYICDKFWASKILIKIDKYADGESSTTDLHECDKTLVPTRTHHDMPQTPHQGEDMTQVVFKFHADADAAALAAAEYLAGCARRAISARGRFVLALSGGRSPYPMIKHFGSIDLPWALITLLQVDERVAAAGDGARNWVMIESALAGTNARLEGVLRPMPVESPDLTTAAAQYAATLAEVAGQPPVIDLVQLGMGDDGHTASLVPGDAVLSDEDRDVALCGLYRGHERMTMTFPVLNRARERLWLVNGQDKAGMLERLRAADRSIPAGCVSHTDTVVFTDVTLDTN